MRLTQSPKPTRREVLTAGAACLLARLGSAQEAIHFNVAEYDRAHILATAAAALKQEPVTITSLPSPVKDLPANTYYSEDTEWWPKPGERRAGLTNPAAFCAHRDALVAANGVIAACTAAWRLTQEAQYAQHALRHLRAWFVDAATRMDPNLEHASTMPPATDGHYRGVEETVMLAETVRSASFLCAYNGVATEEEAAALRDWFAKFATWLNESKKGAIAREAKDRLAICWTLQAAEIARFTRNSALQLDCSHRFRDKLLRQMNLDGQFPVELHRGNPFASSIFTLECLALTCEVISKPMDRLWDATLPDGRCMRAAVAFLFPAMENRGAWKLPADPQNFSDWPVRNASLLLAGRAFSVPEYLALWKKLPVEPRRAEMLRYMPSRQPALWAVRPPA